MDGLTAAGILLLGVLLCLIGAGLMEHFRDGAARRQEPGMEELLAVTAAAAGAGIVLWWIASMACAAASALLERTGRTRAAAATRKLSPAFMQRLVLGALSFQLLSGPVAQAAVTVPGPEWTPTQGGSSSAPAIPGTGTNGTSAKTSAEDAGAGGADVSLLAPVTGPEPHHPPVHVPDGGADRQDSERGQVVLPQQPAITRAAPPSSLNPGWQPAAPVTDPGMLAAPGTRALTGESRPRVEGGVAVQAGDTLWDIAARHLGPGASDLDIALQWPRWHEANRELIGQNPNVLLPGQILHPPFV
ncbi:LysM peptidoglycan-binding domain-containing protein [Arthrobacter sp. AFG7.2]|uniref:LysM peptidoglycan-binding domain-containing protein n=1 Tax=Arthrobacter sp. AFG7.2 TaxID=1688693 RepID=UPI001CB9561D|nr:LysM peptidoglycan-binding domain-containing protein [Arthrobacter sp. AFG7.2]